MTYKYILFDLDGTLTNPEEGITKSVVYSLEKQGIEVHPREHYQYFIGPPLDDSYRAMGMDEDQIAKSIHLYRERFETKGWVENIPYKGIKELLECLQSDHILGVSTSKPTLFAEKILNHFDLAKYFNVIVGSNMDRTRVRKTEVIEETLRQLGNPEIKEVLMVGDRLHDVEGAAEHQMDVVRVLYGFGERDEHVNYEVVATCETVDALKDLFYMS